MLARNAVMLHMSAEQEAPVDAVLAVWANHGLSDAHAALLMESCTAIAERPWPTWLSTGTPEAEAAIRGACRAWVSCTMTLATMLGLRAAVLDVKVALPRALALSLAASGARVGSKLAAQVRAYLETGSLPSTGPQLIRPNVTLLLAPELQYTLYFSSSILRAVPLAAGEGSLSERLLRTLEPQLACLSRGVRDGFLSIQLISGDALAMATSMPILSKFHFIDSSNVADYVSLPALLQACAPLLSTSQHARVRLESIVNYNLYLREGCGKKDGVGFLGTCFSIPPPSNAALLGLQLVSCVELGDGQQTLRAEWSPAAPPSFSAAWLLMQLTPIFSRMVGEHVSVLPPEASSLNSWVQRGAPLTFGHLLSLTAPPVQSLALLDSLLAAAAPSASLFKWELQQAISIQNSQHSPLRRLAQDAQPGLKLLRHNDHPLLLAFSSTPLSGPTSLRDVKQLFTSFAWEGESGCASFLLQASLLVKCSSWYVTLCALSSVRLDAVGRSQTLSSLTAEAVTASPWRSLCSAQLDLDCSALLPSDGAWRYVVHISELHVTVDLKSPGAPIDAEARVRLDVADNVLTATVGQDSFSVPLPVEVQDGKPQGESKLSRAQGLICARIVRLVV